jgi:hypothetical protein
MPSTNASGIGSTARFNLFTSIGGFFSALFDTARHWGDTELMAMPGYHDPIVHVALSEDEGGLNLNMGRDVIMRIAERGERAGEFLAARFAFDLKPDPQSNHEIRLTWDNHRWARFRSFTAALEDVLRRLRATWLDAKEHKPWRSYQELLDREPGTKPKSLAFGTKGQRSFAIDATDDLVNIVAEWTTSDNTFDRGEVTDRGRSPRPKPVLRMMPPGSNDPRLERAGTQSAEPPAAE